MFYRFYLAALLIAALAATPAAAQPGGEITAGVGQQAIYSLSGSPTSQTDRANPQPFTFAPATGVNQLLYNWWFYRVAGDPVQRPFGNYVKSDGFSITGTSNWPAGGNGTTATYQWTEFGPPGGIRFTAAYTMTLSNGPGTADARLSQSFQIGNPNSSPMTISLFNSAVLDPGSRSSGLFASGGLNGISVTDGSYDDTHMAVGATAYQAATDASLGNLLFGGAAKDLNDTGLPVTNSAGTVIDAFEWTFTVPANGSETVSSSLVVARAVPEPSSLLLAAAAALGSLALRRRGRPRRTVR
jgi:hypothetical protein